MIFSLVGGVMAPGFAGPNVQAAWKLKKKKKKKLENPFGPYLLDYRLLPRRQRPNRCQYD